ATPNGGLLSLFGLGGKDEDEDAEAFRLRKLRQYQRQQQLQPVQSLLAGHLGITLQEDEAGRFLSGMRRSGTWPDAPQVAVFAPPGPNGKPVLLGTGHVRAGELIPGRLLSPIEIQQILEEQT
ncbi:MAG: tRNA pseudouridine(55) synthase TruB, partial [Hylemonella sp.]